MDFFEKLLKKIGYFSNKVAHCIFVNEYDVYTWKQTKDYIFFQFDNFAISMSRDDAYYQIYKNAPGIMGMVGIAGR